MVRYAICYHLYNLIYNFTKINTPPWVFFTIFKLYKWYQMAQRTAYVKDLLMIIRLILSFHTIGLGSDRQNKYCAMFVLYTSYLKSGKTVCYHSFYFVGFLQLIVLGSGIMFISCGLISLVTLCIA